MFKNYFRIAFRNLLKYRFISFVNLFGLTIGITCCLMILTYVLHELSYDRYNKNAGRIYRVTRSFNNENGVVSLNLATIAPAFGYYFPGDFPEIEKMTRLLDIDNAPMRYGEKLFNERTAFFADENIFSVFTIDLLKGNPKTALSEPFSVVLTEEIARKYFGDEEPLNKMLRYNNQYNVKVTGVYRAFPSNAHFHPGMMFSFNTLRDSAIYGEKNLRTSWSNNSFFTYLLLPEKYNPQNLIKRFPDFLDKHMSGVEYMKGQPSRLTKLDLQPLTSIHLHSHTDYEAEPNGDIKRVYVFSAIAFFILLIACINYMNLSTARSALRAREIGIRKVIGARKGELVFQFLSESVLISCIAVLLAIGCLYLALPWLNKILGQELSAGIIFQWQILLPLFITPFLIGILSGIYPALFMSSFQPIKTLKGIFSTGGRSISMRKVLVIVQFAISIILIVATAIVFRQLNYMQRKSLGFDKDRMVIIPYNPSMGEKYESFRNELLGNPGIKNSARSSRIPTGRLLDNMGASVLSGDSMVPSKTDIKFLAVDYDFIPTYGIPMAAGRNFSREYGMDTLGFVLNESAIRALGWPSAREAVGRAFKYGDVSGHIIGVIKDFHFESLRQPILPIVMEILPPRIQYYNNLSVKLGGTEIPASLSFLENTWKKYMPETPYQFTFLDDNFDALYKAEQRQGNLFTLFSCIAIAIACLGLLGLSAFAISQRVKEIGVRKVLGADVSTIVALLSKDFLRLVLISAVFSFPLSWFVMHRWLQDFAYRTTIPWWIFILAGFAAALVALGTISYQAIRAAVANPVKALRTE